ncbi:MAG TPA: acyl carrier protein [Actinobacteria bacterium]|jgi:acyl carrier protein|nr:acyl carrier protein [Actinomycetota bacterium]
MAVTEDKVLESVRQAVAEALGIPVAEVMPEATLFEDLGAESIDLLDILFRIEKKTGVKVKAADVGDYVQGGIPDEVFGDENERVSEAGLAHLKKIMPQLDVDALRGNLEAANVINLITVQNLADMVAFRTQRSGD